MNDDINAVQDLVLFVEVARTRSFSQSAENLGLSPATLSRRIHALELYAGARLFNRTTRRVELTNLGVSFLERCGHLVDDAKLARQSLTRESKMPSGHLRISMPVDLGKSIVGHMLPIFAKRYPNITFAIDLSAQISDVFAGEADIALRLKETQDTSLVTQRIGWLSQALFASPTYLELKGKPIHPDELTHHECIYIGGKQRIANWSLSKDDAVWKTAVTGRFSVNNHGLICALAESGMGIAMLEPTLCRDAIKEGRLVPVLSDWTPAKLPVFVVTASKLKNAAATAFIEFVSDRFSSR